MGLSDYIAKPFWYIHADVAEHLHTHYWLAGGRGSTKSSYTSIEVVLRLLENPKMHAVVLRKVASTIKTSTYPQILWALEKLGISGHFTFKTSPPEITYNETGQKIMFFGVDDPQKIKSVKAPFGYIGIVWFEELSEFDGMEEIRNVNQSLMRGGSQFYGFYTYNPPKSRDNWVNKEVITDDVDRLVSITNYTQVPQDWLGAQFILEAEKLKMKNEMLYRHEYLGEVTGTGGDVFDNVEDLRISDAMIKQFDHCYYGVDFGFAIDPLAFVACHYDAKHEILYIWGEIYRIRLGNSEAVRQIKTFLYNPRELISADSAEPKTISEMNSMGLHVAGVKKARDSVEFGIKWLQHISKIYIDKNRCPNTYREFMNYEYEQNRLGEFIAAFPDKNNHAIDATRYALSYVMSRTAPTGGMQVSCI